MNAAHFGGGKDHHIRQLGLQEIPYCRLVSEIQFGMGARDQFQLLAGQTSLLKLAQDSATHHATMTCEIDLHRKPSLALDAYWQLETIRLKKGAPLGFLDIRRNHFRAHLARSDFRFPAQPLAGFARIAEERLNFSWPEITRVDPHDDIADLKGRSLVSRNARNSRYLFHPFA